jgi:hypothetical protein
MLRLTQFLDDALAHLLDRATAYFPEVRHEAPSAYDEAATSVHADDAGGQGRAFEEIRMVAANFERHGPVRWDAEGGWLMITHYPLPGRWRTRWAQLLILIPPSYPVIPPCGFYLDRSVRRRDGGRDHHLTGQPYYTAPDLRALGWDWYCVHVADSAGGWQPSADWREPDNLWSYLHLVRDVLTNED